ncbi:hypothetical protein [Pseudomonas sp. A34-9]|uniref:hypothetical protein n=1 Tax=Pseudomonas sp. A34-9 TaxID=3034675 RepID=UPI00240D5D38|nr:hypothetical protein [Pseudomonas sp. A34-9]
MAAGNAGNDAVSWIAVVIAAAVAAGGSSWAIQLNNVSERDKKIEDRDKQITALREAGSWNIPTTIKSMKSASEEIMASLESRSAQEARTNDIKHLQQENAELASKLKATTSELALVQDGFRNLKSQLQGAAKQPIVIELGEGQSEDIIPGIAALGVKTIYSRSQVLGAFGGQKYELRAGERSSFRIAEIDCKVYIKTITIDKAILSVTCEK